VHLYTPKTFVHTSPPIFQIPRKILLGIRQYDVKWFVVVVVVYIGQAALENG